eukprot:gene12048-13965_t
MVVAAAAVIPKAEEYRVHGLEKFGAHDEMYAGHMPMSWKKNDQGSLFFWLAKHRKTDEPELAGGAEKLIIWLNGGPGCSSMIGMMHENGPFTIEFADSKTSVVNDPSAPKFKLKNNPYSWNRAANVLYVEQPVRTGYSMAAKGKGPTTDEQMLAVDFRHFILSFMEVFPQYKGAELFISGESYAGFYIPWIAEHIVRSQLVPDARGDLVRNVDLDGINLSGVAIGNGVMDMLTQEPSYAEYAYYHGLIPLGAKLKFDEDWKVCLKKIQRSGEPLTRGSFDECDMMTKVLNAAGLPNEYNTATFIQYNSIIGVGSAFMTFFDDPSIQELIHVRGFDLPGINFEIEGMAVTKDEQGRKLYEPPNLWGACSDAVDTSMSNDSPVTVVPQLQFLSEQPLRRTKTNSNSKSTSASVIANSALRGAATATATASTADEKVVANSGTNAETDPLSHAIRVLLYSGELDLNCNTLGTLHTLEANQWRNKPWSHAERSLWKYQNDVAGEYFTMDDVFSFLIVRNSGHLMPMDLPAISLDLIMRFVHGKTFADQVLPSEQSYLETTEALMDEKLQASPVTTSTSPTSAYSGIMLIAVVGTVIAALYLVYKHTSHKDPFSKPSLTTNKLLDHAFGSNKHSYVEIPAVETDKLESIN